MMLRQRWLIIALFLVAAPMAAQEAGAPRELPLPVQLKSAANLGVGTVLVAARGLGDPNFARTVILLTHYQESGVMGLVLNRRTGVPISQVLDLKSAKDRTDAVYRGGPVQPAEVFALLQTKAKVDKAETIFDGVVLITEKTTFDQTLSSHPDPGAFHVYLGYAGWTQAQLQHEVQLGAWFVFPADTAAVFSSQPDTLWQEMIQRTEMKLAVLRTVLDASREDRW